MQYEFDKKLLSTRVRYKRIIEMNVGLREIAKKTKISAATLSRAENERPLDMKTFVAICGWLNEHPLMFFKAKSKKVKAIQ